MGGVQTWDRVLTLSPDRLGYWARVAQAVGIDGSDYEEVDGVGEKAGDRVRLHLDQIGDGLPCAARWLAKEVEDKIHNQNFVAHNVTGQAKILLTLY